MKTRIITTDIWDEDKVFTLNIDTKLLYLILLTNPYIGQSRFYKINDRQLSTFSGLNVEQVKKCKSDLELVKMAYFKDGYVCITGYGFVECFYKGIKNEKAKQKELESIPKEVLEYFKDKLNTLSIPYEYPIDTTINHKSGIINQESGIRNKESENKKIDEIAQIIKEMENIDPKNKNYYGNKTQRLACQFIIETYGYDKVIEMIQIIPTLKMTVPYFPSVTTPCELRDKWQKIIDAVNRSKVNKESKIADNLANVIW